MSATGLPNINTLVDVSLVDGSSHPSRVEDVDGRVFTVAAPYDVLDAQRPEVGTTLDLAWICGGSRFAAPVRLTNITREQPPRWVLQIVGEPRLHTRRAYMRGGGGERIRLTRCEGDQSPVDGYVLDISEGSLRCRVRAGDFERDERLELAITLGDELVKPTARVLVVRRNEETGDFDLVVTYETTEVVGRTIRGYILRRQMEERRRMTA